MSFLNSLPLWAGLAALGVAVPVLIHLWSRSQKFETPWAAMELLKKALIDKQKSVRLKAIAVLGAAGGKEALPILEKSLGLTEVVLDSMRI